METIKLVNWEDGKDFSDYFNPEKKFNIENKLAYRYGENMVSPEQAIQRGFEVSSDFKLPGYVNNRIECGQFVQDVLGISRQKNPRLYFQTWAKLGEGLPHGEMIIGKNRNNNDK